MNILEDEEEIDYFEDFDLNLKPSFRTRVKDFIIDRVYDIKYIVEVVIIYICGFISLIHIYMLLYTKNEKILEYINLQNQSQRNDWIYKFSNDHLPQFMRKSL